MKKSSLGLQNYWHYYVSTLFAYILMAVLLCSLLQFVLDSVELYKVLLSDADVLDFVVLLVLYVMLCYVLC